MPEDIPVAIGQEWEVTGGTGRHRACVVSPPFLAVATRPRMGLAHPEPCVAVQTDYNLGPSVTTIARLRTAGRLLSYPAGPTLDLARAMRARGPKAIEPSALHESAEAETSDSTPARSVAVAALYHHAMAEAGALVPVGSDAPYPRCPICHFPAED